MAKQAAKSVRIAGSTLTSTKELSASDLTKWAKAEAERLGMRVNRVNNVPVRRRKGTVEKGWADIQGYNQLGIYVAIEVKKIGDRLSNEQIERLNDVYECGGLGFICTEMNKIPILQKWTKMEL